MPEDDFRARVNGYQANYYAPNFAGGTGDVNQPGVPTAPASPTITDPNAGKPRPTTLLGQVRAQQDRVGGHGLQTGRAGQLSPDERADIARRGYAPFTMEGIRTAATNALGLMTDPVTTGIETMVGQATGLPLGIQDIPGYESLTPEQIGAYGVPHPASQTGGDGGSDGTGFKDTAEKAGAIAGAAAGSFADPVASGVMEGFKAGLADSDFGGGGGGGNGNQGDGGGAPQGGNPGGHGEYARGGTVGGGNREPMVRPLPRYGALPAHMRQPPRGSGPIDGGAVRPRPVPKFADGGAVDDGADYTAPGSIPDDGVVDNQPIMADEGEFVVRREAAVAYEPAVLRAINDPAMAPKVDALIARFLQEQGGGAQPQQARPQPQPQPMAMPVAAPNAAPKPQPPAPEEDEGEGFRRGGTVRQRPQTLLGRMRAA